MALRITKVDEFQFLLCVKHSVWGSKTDRFKSWKKGDFIVFIVDKHFAALAEVVGESYKSDILVWDNGTFPYRINLNFNIIFSKDNRIPVLGDVRDALVGAWGTSYGWGILNQKELPQDAEEVILKSFRNQTNSIKYFNKNLDILIAEAKQIRDSELELQKNKEGKKRGRKKKIDKTAQDNSEEDDIEEDTIEEQTDKININEEEANQEESLIEGTIHTKAQHLLIKMGKITGCSVWVASNDYNRKYQGESLGTNCIENLPNFGLAKEAMDRIAYIDVIWIQQNAPICAFEVETTTSIYSGILRMADLISLVPALKIKLFIVAPKARGKKVMQELNRPTFKKIGLNEYCRFISIEDLEKKLEQIQDLYGDVRPTIVEKIAIEADKNINY